ncbi:MAG: GDYXXLXY domain-containing protein [Gaiellaceae bacterium]
MSSRRRLALIAVVLAQLAAPLGLAGLAAADLAFGQEVRLRARPIDPLDIFRGNYVVLRYELSALPVSFDVDRGDRVCAPLFEAGDEWRAGPALAGLPENGEAICGRARSDAGAGSEVDVEYGIETYFASERRAKEIERAIGTGRVYVVLDLDDDGSARIERLEIE